LPRSGRGGTSPTEPGHEPTTSLLNRPSAVRGARLTLALWPLALLGALAPIAGHTAEPAAPAVAAPNVAATGCSAKRIGEISVATLNGVPFVTLLANGVPVTLLLDTGAERTVLTPASAQRVGAQPPRVEFDRRLRGIGGTLPIREVELQRFTIGGVPIPWRRIAVAPTTLPTLFFGPLDGVLGADALSYFNVDIDLSRHRMILHDQPPCRDVAPDWAEPYVGIATGRSAAEHLFFPVRLDGREIIAIIDTGARISTLTSKAALALGVSDAVLSGDRSITVRGAAGELVAARIHRFSRVEVAGDAIRDPELIVANLNLRDADLVLGFDFISSRRVWLSYGSRRIFLSRRKSYRRDQPAN
jgi:predicted aspartyl protease